MFDSRARSTANDDGAETAATTGIPAARVDVFSRAVAG
jgi:hypothetical protein